MAITTTQSKNPASVFNMAVGRHINSSAEAAFTITLGFKPRYVKIVNRADDIQGEWFEGMADDSMFKRIQDGTGDEITSTAITVSANGFTLAADSSVNGNNKQLSWVAYG